MSARKPAPDRIESTPLHNINDPIAIKRDYPIVTQAWTPPYKPAVNPLPSTWKSVMEDTETTRKDNKSRDARTMNILGGGSFGPSPGGSPRSAQPMLLGGSQWDGTGGGGGGGGFNAFASAMRMARQDAGGFAAGGGGGGIGPNGMLMAGSKLSALDEDDEYDDRVEIMKGSISMRRPLVDASGKANHHHHHKTRKQRQEARDQYHRQQEQLAASGYHSGGEVDEGCIGALGDDDDLRAERLKFTQDAPMEDGTARTAYRASVAHRRRGGQNMRTPRSGGAAHDHPGGNDDDAIADKSHFRAPGLKTPAYDPHDNLPAPVARFQRRQQHHLLRMLGGAPTGAATAGAAGGAAELHLFQPHEIPANEAEKKKRKFDVNSWMLGDESIDDFMNQHFMKKDKK